MTTSMDWTLEVVLLPVSDIDRAVAFYRRAGFRLDIDAQLSEDVRAVQFTPPGSPASIQFAPAGVDRLQGLLLIVEDIEAARNELVDRGVDVSEIFHDVDGGLGAGFRPGTEGRAPGPDPERRSYASYAAFSDPDGNRWLLQEITERLPGRV